VCDFDMMGAPSKLSVIRKVASLERARPTLLLSESRAGMYWVVGDNFLFLFFFFLEGVPCCSK
jgi:hypothetical protein